MARRIHNAADREVQSGNIAPFASRRFFVSLFFRLFFRTSREAGLFRLVVAAIAIVAAALTGELVVCVLVALAALATVATTWRSLLPRKEWEDPSITGINRLAAHSRLGNYSSFEGAVARGQSRNVVSLSGTWKFFLASGVAKAPKGFEDPEFMDKSWDNINVPGHWQLQDAGNSDPPIYTNTNYPFPNHPPYAPKKNPTGLYRRSFALPAEWLVPDSRDRESGLLASARPKGRVVLSFQGVDSAFHVWVNGVLVGFAKGSRLPCEFDVTDALRENGDQCLCLRVVRWSDGSYLEDQDHWWLSGVYREVELALRPAPARISDFIVRPFLDEDSTGSYGRGSVEIEVLVEHDSAPSAERSTISWGPGGVESAMLGATSSATVRDDDIDPISSDHDSMLFALGKMESGEGKQQVFDLAPRPRVSEGKVTVVCTLMDTVTGEQFSLKPAGPLMDWKMGLPPGEARRPRCGTVNKKRESTISRFLSVLAKRGAHGEVGRHEMGTGAVVSIPPVTTKSVRLFRLDFPGTARAWSAEDPQLYTVVLCLKDEGGEDLQFESARVGFRNVTVASGQFLVNGRAVMVAGVNRHEHDPDTGKTVSEESMRRDILMMKRFNFNAVRNCHYPNHWRWYELCDELGLYVCDEANIESHGQVPLGRLSADPYWGFSYLDRVWRMLASNKNHACVIMWSLGNESGDGENLSACRRLVKDVDPSRPVVYEGGGESLMEGSGCTDLTDIVCPMYSSVEMTELLGTDGPGGVGETRPCVLCEYSHAMGNSNGNLHKYWELFRKHRRLQGGFIWDWVDQGLTKRDALSGRQYWADGGGFSGRHSEGYHQFCLNGVTFPDRSPHPSLWEAKFLAQPVGIELVCDHPPLPSPLPPETTEKRAETNNPSLKKVLVTNRYGFLSLDHLSAAWRLQSAAASGAKSSLATGFLPFAGIAPGESRELEIDVFAGLGGSNSDWSGIREKGELFLHVEVRLSTDSDWAEEGHLVAWGCFPIARVEGTAQPQTFTLRSTTLPSVLSAGGMRDGGNEGAVTIAETIATTVVSPALIVYEDEGENPGSSKDSSPAGQLREHLLSSNLAMAPTSNLIVMKGFLESRGADGFIEEGRAEQGIAGEWMLAVSQAKGTIERFVAGGVDLIEPGAGPSLCLSRAATDNDCAGWPTLLNFVVDHRPVSFLSKCLPFSRLSNMDRWKASGLCARDPPVIETQGVRVEKSSSQECLIKVSSRCMSRRRRRTLFVVTTDIRVSAGGRLELTTIIEPCKGALQETVSLARVGIAMKLPPGFGHVEWFGKGPFECYQDRKHGAKTDVFSGTVEEQHVPYIHPSENGGKADVRWMALRKGEKGSGILLQAETGTVFESAVCSLYCASELQEAKRTVDLPLRSSANDPVFVHLDHRSMGVGGDNSWYPDVVHKEYTVPANKSYRFQVRMEALVAGDAAALVALAHSPSGSPQ